MAAGGAPRTKSLICPNCGAPVELRSGGQSVNAVCGYCNTILDTRTPSLAVIQQFEAKQAYQPLIPLGTRGRLAGGVYETIGFQVRQISVDGVEYQWSEYLLFNPYRGYSYLSEYRGHWNVIRTWKALPVHTFKSNKKAVQVEGDTYVHFQTAQASTVYVLGEFPWQVRVGEAVNVEDYVAPPKMMSAEITADEVAWSQGVYTPGSEIWKAFGLQGSAPAATGIFANQPSPYKGKIGSAWKLFLLFLGILFVLMIGMRLVSANQEVFRQRYAFSTAGGGEAAFVTPVFSLGGRTSNVEVQILTDLSNDWAFFAFALINDDTGQAFDFGKDVEYYFGSDSDGSWTEGNRAASVDVPGVPAGRYYLRVEPEMDRKTSYQARQVSYELVVKRDVPGSGWLWFAFFLLFIPPILVTYKVFKFETQRWAESDYGSPFGSASTSSSDDEEE